MTLWQDAFMLHTCIIHLYQQHCTWLCIYNPYKIVLLHKSQGNLWSGVKSFVSCKGKFSTLLISFQEISEQDQEMMAALPWIETAVGKATNWGNFFWESKVSGGKFGQWDRCINVTCRFENEFQEEMQQILLDCFNWSILFFLTSACILYAVMLLCPAANHVWFGDSGCCQPWVMEPWTKSMEGVRAPNKEGCHSTEVSVAHIYGQKVCP